MIDLRTRLESHLGDRYAVVREIGSGGMATVFLARDTKHGRDIALKVLRPEVADTIGAERFLREIETVARLNHPHILPLYDSGDAGGLLYYAMPYMDGDTLEERLEREGPLPVADALRVASECAEALECAHRAGVVHRDLKPANILLSDGHAVVADFGIARAVEAAADGEALTRTGVSLGSIGYMSPEQASGGRAVDSRSDVYVLGAVLFEMLTGERAFPGRSFRAVMARQVTASPPSLTGLRHDVPAGVERVIQKALRPIPADRYPSAEAFSLDLETASRGPEGAGHPPRRLGRPALASLLALIMAGLAWGSVTLMAGNRPATALAGIRSVAVVPLENLAPDPDTEQYFADGMTEALTAELGGISALTVKLPTSAGRLFQRGADTREVARALAVDALLMGSVLRDANEVVITVRLVEGSTGEVLWTNSYPRSLSGVLTLHSEVARDVAAQVQVVLTPTETARLAASQPVDSVAYDHYLRGRYEWNKLNFGGWQSAIEHFERSIGQDPSFAPAHAMLSSAHSLLGYYSTIPPSRLHSRALASAERAVGLDSTSAMAHASLSLVMTTFDWDWAAADSASLDALRLNPSAPLAHVARSFFLSWVGRHEEAIAIQRRAVEVDPEAAWARSWLAAHLFFARRYDEAIAEANRAISLEPASRDAHLWLMFSYAKKGMIQEAERVNRLLISALDMGGNTREWKEAWLLGMAGDPSEAREIIDRIPSSESNTPYYSYFMAAALGEAGDVDGALSLLERCYQGRCALMAVLKVDPRLDALRQAPRFQDLVRRMDFPDV